MSVVVSFFPRSLCKLICLRQYIPIWISHIHNNFLYSKLCMYICMYVCVAEFSGGEFYAVCAHSEPLSLSAGPVLPLQGARPACHGTVIHTYIYNAYVYA